MERRTGVKGKCFVRLYFYVMIIQLNMKSIQWVNGGNGEEDCLFPGQFLQTK